MSAIENIFELRALSSGKAHTAAEETSGTIAVGSTPAPDVLAVADVAPAVEMLVEQAALPQRTRIAAVDPAHLQRMRILPPNPSGPAAAPYRMLRTQVLRRMDELQTNMLAIMSARANDGKTLTAINLAVSFAADLTRTVLLVDLDLRNPTVHRYFGVAPSRGVEDHLQMGTPIEQVVLRPEGYERLTLLPATRRVEESAELLSGRRMFDLILELRSRYSNRLIVVDLPPVLEVDDALSFAPHVPAALLVVGEGRSHRDDVTRSLQMLKDTTFIGTVLNASREKVGCYY